MLAPQYKFYYEGDANPFADLTAEGSFTDRRYTFKNGRGETVARVARSLVRCCSCACVVVARVAMALAGPLLS